MFVTVVPILIAVPTLLFAFGERLKTSGWRVGTDRSCSVLKPLLFAPVAIYGGYFGAGMGVMTLAIPGAQRPWRSSDHKPSEKPAERARERLAIAIYIVYGIVAWPETTAMMAGALVGGFVGGRSMRSCPLSYPVLWWSAWVRSLRSYSNGDTGWSEPPNVSGVA